MILPQRPPVFVINLPESDERRTAITERLDALGVAFDIFPAVNGKTLSAAEMANYDEAKRIRLFGKGLTRGEIGCYLSHYRLWQRIIDEDLPCALIMEDDAVPEADFPVVLDQIMAISEPSWDMLRFFGGKNRKGRLLHSLECGYSVLYPRHITAGAVAYLLTRQGAEKLLRHGREILWPVDNLMDRYWESGLRIEIIKPWPVTHLPEPESDINRLGGHRADIVENRNFQVVARRRIRKLGDRIGRLLFALRGG